ncbi:hypothetical protein [Leifsonia shinshuensis]
MVASFNALSAVGGGAAVLLTNGLGMPASMLKGGPFASFLWPGIILLVVVGGTQSLAVGLLLARRPSALAWTAVAGFGMIIWIFVETGIIRGLSWLQALYFTTGVIEVALVLVLLGVMNSPFGAGPGAPVAAGFTRPAPTSVRDGR